MSERRRCASCSASCSASWQGVDGDACPKCGEARQCVCEHCEQVRAKKAGVDTTYTGVAGEGSKAARA